MAFGYSTFENNYNTSQSNMNYTRPAFYVTSENNTVHPADSWIIWEHTNSDLIFRPGESVYVGQWATFNSSIRTETISEYTYEGVVDLDQDGLYDGFVVSDGYGYQILSDQRDFIDFSPYSDSVSLDRRAWSADGLLNAAPDTPSPKPETSITLLPEEFVVFEPPRDGDSYFAYYFTVQLSQVATLTTEFSVTLVDSDGKVSKDVSVLEDSITFEAGQDSASFIVTVYPDLQEEPIETVSIVFELLSGMPVDKVENSSITIINDSPFTDGSDEVSLSSSGDYAFALAGNDIVNALGGADVIYGDAGHDTLNGGNGNDYISGGTGNDKISGDKGADNLFGDKGNDIIVVNTLKDSADGGAGRDTLDAKSVKADIFMNMSSGKSNFANDMIGFEILLGGSGDDKLRGSTGSDVIDGGGGDDNIAGRPGDDTLLGGAGNDAIRGDAGADTIEGGNGDDELFGGGYGDIIDGGRGRDRIDGGDGQDLLTGGAHEDRFVFTGAWAKDTITDFQQGLDQIVLKDLRDENGGKAINFNQLILEQSKTTVRILLDLDRNGKEDRLDLDDIGGTEFGRIEVLNADVSDFSKADFIF